MSANLSVYEAPSEENKWNGAYWKLKLSIIAEALKRNEIGHPVSIGVLCKSTGLTEANVKELIEAGLPVMIYLEDKRKPFNAFKAYVPSMQASNWIAEVTGKPYRVS